MRLKIEYAADEMKSGEVTWNPENFHIWLNGLELDLVSALELRIFTGDAHPEARITFTPSEIDIDADAVAALTALLENAEEVDDEEAVEEEA